MTERRRRYLDDDEPNLGRLLTAIEAERHLGIRASTVRTWANRSQWTGLFAAGLDRTRNRPLYWEADLLALRRKMRVRDAAGRRIITMADVEHRSS